MILLPTGGWAQVHPDSTLQSAEQPSPLARLASSHSSLPKMMPSPHADAHMSPEQSGSIWQSEEQPSKGMLLPSSHTSPASIFRSPQMAVLVVPPAPPVDVAGTVVPPAPPVLASVGKDASTPTPPFDVDRVVTPPMPPVLLTSLVSLTPASEETAPCPPIPLDVVPPAPQRPLSSPVFRLPRLQPSSVTKLRQATAIANLETIRRMVAQFRLERNAHNHHRARKV